MVPLELALAALLHDASEAYISDISRPLKYLLPQYRDIENIIQNAIHDKYNIGPLSFEEEAIIKKVDNILLVTEARDLLPGANYKEWGIVEEPLATPIEPLTSNYTYLKFIFLFNKYCPKEFRLDHFV